MMKSKVDTQKVLKQLREKVDREIQGAEADIESIRKALTIPEKAETSPKRPHQIATHKDGSNADTFR